MDDNYPGEEWQRVLKMVSAIASKPGRMTTFFPDLPKLDQVKAVVAMACSVPTSDSLKILQMVAENAEPELLLSALQIVPREQLAKVVLQRFEGSTSIKLVQLIIESLSGEEVVFFALLSCLGSDKLLLTSFTDKLGMTRCNAIFQMILKKEGKEPPSPNQ